MKRMDIYQTKDSLREKARQLNGIHARYFAKLELLSPKDHLWAADLLAEMAELHLKLAGRNAPTDTWPPAQPQGPAMA